MNADTYSQDEVPGVTLEDEKDTPRNSSAQSETNTQDIDGQLGEKDPGKRFIVQHGLRGMI